MTKYTIKINGADTWMIFSNVKEARAIRRKLMEANSDRSIKISCDVDDGSGSKSAVESSNKILGGKSDCGSSE